MELSIQERLKDLRVERGLTLEQLAEQTLLSKSALGGYEAEDNPLKGLSQTVEETAREDSDPEQVSLAFICKRLKLNLKKLCEEEKKWLKRISEKSNLLKNPNPQRGRK